MHQMFHFSCSETQLSCWQQNASDTRFWRVSGNKKVTWAGHCPHLYPLTSPTAKYIGPEHVTKVVRTRKVPKPVFRNQTALLESGGTRSAKSCSLCRWASSKSIFSIRKMVHVTPKANNRFTSCCTRQENTGHDDSGEGCHTDIRDAKANEKLRAWWALYGSVRRCCGLHCQIVNFRDVRWHLAVSWHEQWRSGDVRDWRWCPLLIYFECAEKQRRSEH